MLYMQVWAKLVDNKCVKQWLFHHRVTFLCRRLTCYGPPYITILSISLNFIVIFQQCPLPDIIKRHSPGSAFCSFAPMLFTTVKQEYNSWTFYLAEWWWTCQSRTADSQRHVAVRWPPVPHRNLETASCLSSWASPVTYLLARPQSGQSTNMFHIHTTIHHTHLRFHFPEFNLQYGLVGIRPQRSTLANCFSASL